MPYDEHEIMKATIEKQKEFIDKIKVSDRVWVIYKEGRNYYDRDSYLSYVPEIESVDDAGVLMKEELNKARIHIERIEMNVRELSDKLRREESKNRIAKNKAKKEKKKGFWSFLKD